MLLAPLKKAVQNFWHRAVNSAQTGLEALARSIAAKGGSGAAKFQAARAAVVAVLTAKGIPVVENAVQGAILAAVANLND